ncbi:hypothetical protein CCM_03251 [Cordyceps militaris CM01]|uniref:Uncharacterized protein n=1 Tax=Cordyceps militaris (strain CM01) TaxID=983644 RepID=G3J9Q6_CORMM|nr:uncharacterized protein CCM_03251 [Cordyceps militaris CM01]EGX94979.1 hypothetical protein CCM_03251 [Cordyceps militaris CM01]
MEKQSPTDSISPSTTASGSSNPSIQPTYTTAGTIYNPNTSQPLQPPTRRGRAPKWTSGGAYSDLSLLPRSLIATLQAKSNGRSSPYNVAQYTPLQQNYDRAANPISKNGCFDEMGHRWNSTPGDAGLEVDEVGYNAIGRDPEEDDDDEDGDDGMDSIMMNMPVKSLHNLASYANPNQKKAQKALLRPIKPRLNPQNTYSAHDMPVQHWDPRPSPDHYDRSWAKLRPSYSDSVASQLMAKAELQSITARSQHQEVSPPPNIEDVEAKNAWLTHMALGAPRPLTAGPPGQRQYRASTFKSTFKALSTETKATKQMDDDDAYAITARVLQHAGIDDARGRLEGSLSRHESESNNYTQLFQGSQQLPRGSPNGSYGIVGSPDKGYKRRGVEEFTASDAALTRPEWGTKGSYQQFRGDAEYEANLATQTEKMNKLWYHGCETLCGEAVGEADKARDTYVGVIGDGRPRQSGWNRHSPLAIEEANKMEVSEHTKPLLDMAMANLERRLEELLKKGREQDTN